jgi:hypothetical protein
VFLPQVLNRLESLERVVRAVYPGLGLGSTNEQSVGECSRQNNLSRPRPQTNVPICSDEPVDEVQSRGDDEKEGRQFSQCGSTVQTDRAPPAGMMTLPWNTVSGTMGDFAYYVEVENPDYTMTRQMTQKISRHSGRRENLGPSHHAIPASSDTRTDSSYMSAADSSCNQRGRIAEPHLRSGTVSRLANLYLENVNAMHPILSPSQLGSLVDSLMKSRNVGSTSKPSNIGNAGTRHLKRKQSFKRIKEPKYTPHQVETSPPSVERSLVLVALALGEMYDHNILPVPNGYTPPEDVHWPWTADPPTYMPEYTAHEFREMDAAPGLAYFAAAADILRDETGENHVQVHILASLYHGQLAQVSQSRAYLHETTRALQFLLRM